MSKRKVGREDVATYAIEHNVRGTLNEMLNLTLRQMPEDPIRYLADLLESRASNSGIIQADVKFVKDFMGNTGLEVSIRTSKVNTSFAFSCIDRSVSESDSIYMDHGKVEDEKIRKKLKRRTEEDIERLADVNAEKLERLENQEKINLELCKKIKEFLKSDIFPAILGESPKEPKLLDVTLKSILERSNVTSETDQKEEEEEEEKEQEKEEKKKKKTDEEEKDNTNTKNEEEIETPYQKLQRIAVLATSIAIWKAGAEEKKRPTHDFVANTSRGIDSIMMPVPIVPVISGGVYSRNEMPFDSIELVPVQSKSYSNAISTCKRIQTRIRSILEKKKTYYFGVSSNSGATEVFGLSNVVDALQIVHEAIEAENEKGNVKIGISASADRYYRAPPSSEAREKRKIGTYDLGYKTSHKPNVLDESNLTKLYRDAVSDFDVVVIADPFASDQFGGYAETTEEFSGSGVQILGKSIITRVNSVQQAARRSLCNGVCVRLSEMTTVSEALEIAKLVKKKGWGLAVSTETFNLCDPVVADLAIAMGSRQIRFGGMMKVSNARNYDRLKWIEETFEKEVSYAGARFLSS